MIKYFIFGSVRINGKVANSLELELIVDFGTVDGLVGDSLYDRQRMWVDIRQESPWNFVDIFGILVLKPGITKIIKSIYITIYFLKMYDNLQSLIETNFNGNRVRHPVNKRFRFLLSVGRLDALDFHLNHLTT